MSIKPAFIVRNCHCAYDHDTGESFTVRQLVDRYNAAEKRIASFTSRMAAATTPPAKTPEERLMAKIDELVDDALGGVGGCIHNPSDLREFAASVIQLMLARKVA